MFSIDHCWQTGQFGCSAINCSTQWPNGAGCSVQEELFMSFEQILAVSDKNKTPFDRIVLENSGVAEPQNIREAFTQAMETGHPVCQRIHLSTMVRLWSRSDFRPRFWCTQ